MTPITVQEIKEWHRIVIEETGGLDGVRDQGALESAVYSVYAGFADTETYPTPEEKAARLAFSLITGHAFVDGNKRIGVIAMAALLSSYNISLQCTEEGLIFLGLAVACHELKFSDILAWIRDHKRKDC